MGGSPGSAPRQDPVTPTQTGPALRSPATVEVEAATCCSSLDTAATAATVVAADDDAAERGCVVAVRLDVETRHSAPGSCIACWSILSGILSKETGARSPSPLYILTSVGRPLRDLGGSQHLQDFSLKCSGLLPRVAISDINRSSSWHCFFLRGRGSSRC